jgi:hypothetical protein
MIAFFGLGVLVCFGMVCRNPCWYFYALAESQNPAPANQQLSSGSSGASLSDRTESPLSL